MWDQLPEDQGQHRYDELCENAWKEMISKGASAETISNRSPSAKFEAERILGELIEGLEPIEVDIHAKLIKQSGDMQMREAGMNAVDCFRVMQASAERSLAEMQRKLHQESQANAAKRQEMIRVKEEQVAYLKSCVEEQAHDRQVFLEKVRQEREKERHEMKEVRVQMRKVSHVIAVGSPHEVRERDREVAPLKRQTLTMDQAEKSGIEHMMGGKGSESHELKELQKLALKLWEQMCGLELEAGAKKRREDEQATVRKTRIKQLKLDHKKAESDLKELQAHIRRQVVTEANKMRKATSELQRRIDTAKSQAVILATKPAPQLFYWWFKLVAAVSK